MGTIIAILVVVLTISVIVNFYQSKTYGTTANKYYPGTPQRSGGFFPYLRSDATYTTWIMVCNRTDYLIDVNFTYRGPTGSLVSQTMKTLSPHAVVRLSKAGFTGSVDMEAMGDFDALYTMLEMRDNAGNGVALAAIAGTSHGMPWFFYLGVDDHGPGKYQTTLFSHNFNSQPIYVEYGFDYAKCSVGGKDSWATKYFHEIQVPAEGHASFKPYDVAKEAYAGDINACGNTGPKRSGKQYPYHTGAHFVSGPKDIALLNYRRPLYPATSGWPKEPELYWFYFAGVQDDGIKRADQIYVKNTSNQTGQSRVFNLHFYDTAGKAVPLASGNKLCLTLEFDSPGSYQEICPRKMLGQDFNGSVVIEVPLDLTGHCEAAIRRQAPGSWQDLSDASPGRPYAHHIIPYVSNKEADWTYQIILFYPDVLIKKAPPAPQDQPKPFNGPKIKVPALGGGWVALKLYEMTGKYLGWIAVKFNANETRYYTVNQLVGKYLKEPFSGSIEVEPKEVVSQLHLWDKQAAHHGFTGTWNAF